MKQECFIMYQLNPLLETTVARRLLDSGKLSTKDIMRLRRAHMVPTKKQFIDGVNRGTDNMLRKMGAKVTPIEDPLASHKLGGFKRPLEVFIPDVTNKVVHNDRARYSPAQIAIIRRHEAREAARTKSSYDSFMKRLSHKQHIDDNLELADHYFGHNTGVLSDEGKLLDQLQRRYGIKTKDEYGAFFGVDNELLPGYIDWRGVKIKPRTLRVRRDEGNALYGLSARDEAKIKDKIARRIKEHPEELTNTYKIKEWYEELVTAMRKRKGLPEVSYNI